MGDTCSRVVGTTVILFWIDRCFRKREGGETHDAGPIAAGAIENQENEVAPSSNSDQQRMRSRTFSTSPTPHVVSTSARGENGELLSLVDICIRCLCQHPEAWGALPETAQDFPACNATAGDDSQIVVDLHVANSSNNVGAIKIEEQPRARGLFSNLAPYLVSQLFEQLVAYRGVNEDTVRYFEYLSVENVICKSYHGLSEQCFVSMGTFLDVTQLDLSGCVLLRDDQLVHLATTQFASMLRIIKLERCVMLTDESVVPLLLCASSSICKLNISGCSRLGEGTAQVLLRCKSLVSIELARCGHLPLEIIAKVVYSLRFQLELLDINLCAELAERLLLELCCYCSKELKTTHTNETCASHGCTHQMTRNANQSDVDIALNVKDNVQRNNTSVLPNQNHIQAYELTVLRSGWCFLPNPIVEKVSALFSKLQVVNLSRSMSTKCVLSRLAQCSPDIRELDLSGCKLLGDNLSYMNSFRNLQVLVLERTRVAQLPIKLEGLRVLSLAHSDISATVVKSIGNHLQSLEDLNMEACAITSADMLNLQSLSNLRKLSLCDTDLDDQGLINLGASTLVNHLRHLDVSGSNLNIRGSIHLGLNFTSLSTLSIGSPYFGDDCVKRLLAPKRLKIQELDLFSAPITDRACSTIANYLSETLRKLEVCGGHVTDCGVETLCKVTKLESLNLTSNRSVTNKALPIVASKLVNLRVLNLSHTGVGREGIEALRESKSIEELSISGCDESSVSEEWIAEFQRELPNLWFVTY